MSSALHAAQRRAARVAEIVPMLQARLARRQCGEALDLLADAVEWLEGGPLFTFHVAPLDTVLALAAVAREMVQGVPGLADRAGALLERAVALRCTAIT